MHYGSLDAACLIPILKKLELKAAEAEHADKITVDKFTRPLIFGQKLVVPDVITDTTEKKDNKKDRRKRKRGPRRKKDAREGATADNTDPFEDDTGDLELNDLFK